MARKMCCSANKDMVQTQLIINQSQRKREVAATLLFVYACHWNFQQMTTVTLQRFKLKLDYMLLCILTLW